MAAALDTLCGVTTLPVGCFATFVVQGATPGDFLRFEFNGVTAGTVVVDANGDSSLTLSSGLVQVWTVDAFLVVAGETTWNSGTTYGIGDHVIRSGIHYVSLQAGNTNHVPASSPTWWDVFDTHVAGPFTFTWASPGACFDYVTEPVLTATIVGGGNDVELDWAAASHCDPRYGSTITYDVVRDGLTIAAFLPGLTYTDTGLPPGTYHYHILAVWDTTFLGGLTAVSNTVTVVITAEFGLIDLSRVRYRIGDPSVVPAGTGIDVSAVRFRAGTAGAAPVSLPDGSIGLDDVRFRVGE